MQGSVLVKRQHELSISNCVIPGVENCTLVKSNYDIQINIIKYNICLLNVVWLGTFSHMKTETVAIRHFQHYAVFHRVLDILTSHDSLYIISSLCSTEG